MSNSAATVHIIDDDDALRDSLSFLLGSVDIRTATHTSADSFLAAFEDLSPACIVTDIRMPETTGIELLRRLKEKGADVPVIVITGHGDVPLAVQAMRLGAVDFLEKPFGDDTFIAAVRAALTRRQATDMQRGRKAEVLARLDSLSPRERQVLDGLVAGSPNKNIAYDLGISPRTVEIYRANVMMKMNAGSLSELIRFALLTGALQGEEPGPT